ncbi:peroxiredoxin family protein [Halobacillus hunanensis]|uniref:peroxiredoxin family protein n=1 Tax=Halobacillus hunanensis TaxID=578214 RepID=UPI0009A7C4FD|nr:redoxin domain-containing protein [Halobacillus hunanensis]
MSVFKLGEKIPNFTLPAVSGEDYTFEDYRQANEGYWHLLIYFRGSWCPACMEELKGFEESKSHFDDKKVKLTTISTDNLESLKKMVDKHGFTFPVLSDSDLTVLAQYDVYYHGTEDPYEDHGTHGEPAYFLTDERGNLLYQQRQTSPFGRPNPKEIGKIIKYISENFK